MARGFYRNLPKDDRRRFNHLHLEKLCKAGWTDQAMAEFFGVSHDTLSRWRKRYPDIDKEMTDWKNEADEKVERAMYDRAKGFYAKETLVFCNQGVVTEHEVLKYYPPSEVAGIFWLTNRKRHDWKRTRGEDAADPLSVKVYQVMNQNGKKKENQSDNKNVVTIERAINGGVEIVK